MPEDNKIIFLSQPKQESIFEQAYLSVRENEGRLFTDADVARLPHLNHSHPLAKEWSLRDHSCLSLIKYLKKRNFKNILEIGCGNGWFSNKIATSLDAKVTGIDINSGELQQAARVFHSSNLSFAFGDPYFNQFPANDFDCILFDGAIQYFKDLQIIFSNCFSHLITKGEIHIIDSPVYKNEKAAEEASARSKKYYEGSGMAAMADFYFHHSWSQFENINYSVIKQPSVLAHYYKRIPFSIQIFPWICVKPPVNNLRIERVKS
jgi:ubiquinone/menaquinone biosynthesis C-methylase UbiE